MDKVVLWGAGQRGYTCVSRFGKESIVAIVDSDSAKWGKDVSGVEVIAPEKFFDKYSSYVVIITMKYRKEEIEKLLSYHKVKYVSIDSTREITLMGVIDLLYDFIFKDKLVDYKIIGHNILSIYIQLISKRRGVNTSFDLFDENTSSIGTNDCREMQINTNINERIYGENVVNLYDVLKDKNPTDLSYFKDIKDLHKNEACFVIAMGPSLTISDLDMIADAKVYTFVVNNMLNELETTRLKPDCYCAADIIVTGKNYNQIIESNIKNKIITATGWLYELNGGDIHFLNCIPMRAENDDIEYKLSIEKGIYAMGTVINDVAIPMAIHMGFTKIYLVGADCNYSDKRGTHFGEQKQKELFSSAEDVIINSYKVIKRYADACGVKIFNATRGGMLEVFERVNLDNIVGNK